MSYVTNAERIGMKRGSKEAILEVLDERFGDVPSDIRNYIDDIESEKKLKKLLRLAVKCASIDEFIQMLNNTSFSVS